MELAPWQGGAFERHVKSKKMVGRAHFSLDDVLNFCPLSYVSGEDMEEPITPSHLVVGRQILSLPDNLDYVCDDLDDEEFTLDATSRVRHLNISSTTFGRGGEQNICGRSMLTFARKHQSDGSWRL